MLCLMHTYITKLVRVYVLGIFVLVITVVGVVRVIRVIRVNY